MCGFSAASTLFISSFLVFVCWFISSQVSLYLQLNAFVILLKAPLFDDQTVL